MLNFVTFDNRFVVKAITKKQQKAFLRERLCAYYNRVMNNSFLQHIYGVVKLTIKGQNYSLMILENNPALSISSETITVSVKNSAIDVDCIAYEEVFKDKFSLDIDLKAEFQETLGKDLEYLSKSKAHSWKIVIDILKDRPPGNRRAYSGIYQGIHSFLSVRIYDIAYTYDNTRSKRLSSSGGQISVDHEALLSLKSKIDNYIL